MEITLASGWELEAWGWRRPPKAEGQGDLSVLRTPTSNTQVEKKPARERKIETEGREIRKVWCHGGQGQRVLWRSESQALENTTEKYQL